MEHTNEYDRVVTMMIADESTLNTALGLQKLDFSSKFPLLGEWVDMELVLLDPIFVQSRAQSVRNPTTGTMTRHDGPNHLGLCCEALPEHQMALITSDCAPFRSPASGLQLTQHDWCVCV